MPCFGGTDKHALMRFDWTADRLRLDDEIGVATIFRPVYVTSARAALRRAGAWPAPLGDPSPTVV